MWDKAQREQVNSEIGLLQKSLDELKSNAISAIEIQEMLQSFGILYQELQPHKQHELLGYILKSVKVWPTHIEMALFGRAILERFTLTGGVFAVSPNWLPVVGSIRTWAGAENAFKLPKVAIPTQNRPRE